MPYTKEEQKIRDRIARQIKWKNATIEELEERKRKRNEYVRKNKDKVKEYSRRNIIKQGDYRRKNSSEWKKNNKERAYEHKKKWRIKNKTKVNEYNRKYKIKNKESYLKAEYARIKKKREEDPIYKLRCNIRNSIRDSFRRSLKKHKKDNKTEVILGCSISEFINYILSLHPEKNLKPEDFGQFKYHIDHIIPISSAESYDEVIKLCHYTNFQPLWWRENIQKSNKIIKN